MLPPPAGAGEETANTGEIGPAEGNARVAGIRRSEKRKQRPGTVPGTVRAGGNRSPGGYISKTRFRPPRKSTQTKTVAQWMMTGAQIDFETTYA